MTIAKLLNIAQNNSYEAAQDCLTIADIYFVELTDVLDSNSFTQKFIKSLHDDIELSYQEYLDHCKDASVQSTKLTLVIYKKLIDLNEVIRGGGNDITSRAVKHSLL